MQPVQTSVLTSRFVNTNRSNGMRDWMPRGESDASVTTGQLETMIINFMTCLLYTSDAADE